MKKTQQLYEGKAKKVYATDVEGIYIVDYKDDATAFNGEKKGTIAGKGVINNSVGTDGKLLRSWLQSGAATT